MYARQFVRLSFLHQIIGSTDELAMFDLNLSTPLGDTPVMDAVAVLAELDLEAISDAYVDNVLSPGTVGMANYGEYFALKAAAVGVDGHYLDDPLTYDAGSVAGAASGVVPQSSVVVSLRASSNLGQGKRGRIYIPYTRPQLLTNSPYTNLNGAIATQASEFLADVNSAAGPTPGGPTVCIMGQTGSGTVQRVTSVRVGNVIDTQRRRRDQLTETYVSAIV